MGMIAKKVDCIFEKPFGNCWLAFFCGFQEKIEQRWKNCLIGTADWGRQQDTQNKRKVARTLGDLKNVFTEKIEHCNWSMFVT